SRILEDAGTLSSPLVPWNTCGAFMFTTLGVYPFAYAPYAFLNLITPVVSVIYGFTGWTMERMSDEEIAELEKDSDQL
ncbi:MAG: sodium:proton antiporter, partial [Candidatus Marinimicrobia bacterium CG08_land_8_20_14_0_20_45_22]